MAAPTGGNLSGVAVAMIGAGVVLIVAAVTGQTIVSVLRQSVGLEPAQPVRPAAAPAAPPAAPPAPAPPTPGGGGGGGPKRPV